MVIVKIRACYGDGFVGVMREDSEGTSSVKGHSTNRGNIDIVLIQNTLDRGADASPDVICGLLLQVIVNILCHERIGEANSAEWMGMVN